MPLVNGMLSPRFWGHCPCPLASAGIGVQSTSGVFVASLGLTPDGPVTLISVMVGLHASLVTRAAVQAPFSAWIWLKMLSVESPGFGYVIETRFQPALRVMVGAVV